MQSYNFKKYGTKAVMLSCRRYDFVLKYLYIIMGMSAYF